MRSRLFVVVLCLVGLELLLPTAAATRQKKRWRITDLKMPKQEERIRAHFRIPAEQSLPATPDRVANISVEEFRVYALRGQPVIVTDGMRGWGGKDKWNCQYFHDTFPNESVGGFTAYKEDALKWRRKLGDPWFKQRETLNIPEEEADPKNPEIMSWYFSAIGVDGTRGHETKRNQTVVDMIKADYHLPYFLEPSKLNNDTVLGRLEFFFGTEGAGVHPHTDPVCQWIFSGQVAGRKSWRLSLPYNIELLEKENPGYKFKPSDGNELLAMMMNKAPIYEFTLNPGEIMFFPPGMIHTTRATGKECSTSLSLQFGSPNPVHYVKEFSADLSSDVVGASRCFVDHFNNWLFGAAIPNEDGSPEANREFCDLTFKDLDADGSGGINRKEALEFYERLKAEDEVGAGGLVAEDPALDADSFIQVHDTNQDGLVSRVEFDALVFALYTPRMARLVSVTEKPSAVSYFFQADADSDDYVTEAEFKKAFPNRNWKDALRYDDDGDGKIFQGEWHQHVAELYQVFTGTEYDLEDLGEEANDEKEEADGEEDEDEDDEDEDSSPEPPAAGLRNIKMSFSDEEKVRHLWKISPSAGGLPVKIQEVENLKEDEFLDYARRGQPILVKDGMKDMPKAQEWTCDHFKDKYPEEPVKACAGCSWKKLKQTPSLTSVPPAFWEYQALGEYTVIGVNTPERDPKIVQELRGSVKAPYFVPKSKVNELLHQENLNVFFGTLNGTSGPHTDMNCFWSVYNQARGSSQWRITVPYNVRQLQLDNSDYTYYPPDGSVLVERMLTENPVYEFTLEEGQSVVMPPGLLKHYSISAAYCSVVFRTVFMDPPPVDYVKILQEPLMSDSEGAAGCYTDHYNRWLLGSELPSSSGTEESNVEYTKEGFALFDKNGDGKVTLAEAVARFPSAVTEGAIRTPELDGKAFMQANTADGQESGVVTSDLLLGNVKALWTEVISEVGTKWFQVDARNAEEGGNWEGYGKAVDSIRFRYPREMEVKFDEHGNAIPAALVKGKDTLIVKFPPGGERHHPIPADYPLVAKELSGNVLSVGNRDGNGIGFMFWKKENKKYGGQFINGKRHGKGVFCCKGEEMVDQDWSEKDTDPLAMDPLADEEITDRSDLEVVLDIPDVEFMGSLTLSGLVALRWKDTGDLFVGSMVDGKRLGKGVFIDGKTGEQEVQEWKQGDDRTNWWKLMEFE